MADTTLDRTLSLPELARAWGWTQGKLWRLVKARRIPHLRDGMRIYFEVSAVERWKAARRQPELPQASAMEEHGASRRPSPQDERAALNDLIDPAIEYPWD